MNLFILGATGGIGQHLVEIGLERGHNVTACVRSPQKIASTHNRLRVIKGDVFDPDQMGRDLTGQDIVLSAFGPLAIRSCTLRRDFGRALATAIRCSGIKRLQLVSAAFLFRIWTSLPVFSKQPCFGR